MKKSTLYLSFILSILLITLALPALALPSGQNRLSDEDLIRAGERIYRDGILPSGEKMEAVIRGDVFVEGTSFSCVSCHLKSGLGSIEGQILSPPVTGLRLYKPYYQYNPVIPDPSKPRKSMMDSSMPKPLYRPAYTDSTLAEAISNGVNPVGRPLEPVMPRYVLNENDMSILIGYLKNLSGKISPGVTEREIRFATVIAGDVNPKDRSEMLSLLSSLINDHNRRAKKRNRYLKYGDQTRAAPFNYPDLVLSVWELQGDSSTWRSQLEECYRKEPVFALIGGLAEDYWLPVHEFCEKNRIPCLFPATDLPVISDNDWYTLYLSKGVYLEGEVAARYLGRYVDADSVRTTLQIVEDSPRARAAATGFLDAWKELGRNSPVTIWLSAGEQITADKLLRFSDKEKPDAILLWTSAGTIAALAELPGPSRTIPRIHLSATLIQDGMKDIPDAVRSFAYISYPYRITEGKDPFHVNSRAWLAKRAVPVTTSRISTRLFSLSKVLLEPFQVVKRDFNPAGRGDGLVIMEEQTEMMIHVKRNYYRDYLLDVIGMMTDSNSIDYERLSFGPGQRYASKGCYIVKLAPGNSAEMIQMSDWVIY